MSRDVSKDLDDEKRKALRYPTGPSSMLNTSRCEARHGHDRRPEEGNSGQQPKALRQLCMAKLADG